MGSSSSEVSWNMKLPLLVLRRTPPGAGGMESPEHSGMVTPPLSTSAASVPFGWEEEPGKPRPCTDLILHSNPNPNPTTILLPPPPMRMESGSGSKITKIPSPTTVLDGPYGGGGRRLQVGQSSSFRTYFFRDKEYREKESLMSRQPSYGSSSSTSFSPDHHHHHHHRLLVGPTLSNGGGGSSRSGGFFGKKKRNTNTATIRGSSVFSASPSGLEEEEEEEEGIRGMKKKERIRRNGSFSSLYESPHPTSHFWSAIYKGFKQVIPWTRKSNKEEATSPI